MTNIIGLQKGDSFEVIYKKNICKATVRANYSGLKKLVVDIDLPKWFGLKIKIYHVDILYQDCYFNSVNLDQPRNQAPPKRDENIEKPFCPMENFMKRRKEYYQMIETSKQFKIMNNYTLLSDLKAGQRIEINLGNVKRLVVVSCNYPHKQSICLRSINTDTANHFNGCFSYDNTYIFRPFLAVEDPFFILNELFNNENIKTNKGSRFEDQIKDHKAANPPEREKEEFRELSISRAAERKIERIESNPDAQQKAANPGAQTEDCPFEKQIKEYKAANPPKREKERFRELSISEVERDMERMAAYGDAQLKAAKQERKKKLVKKVSSLENRIEKLEENQEDPLTTYIKKYMPDANVEEVAKELRSSQLKQKNTKGLDYSIQEVFNDWTQYLRENDGKGLDVFEYLRKHYTGFKFVCKQNGKENSH